MQTIHKCLVLLFIIFSFRVFSQTLISKEFYNNSSSNQEYLEFVVLSDTATCHCSDSTSSLAGGNCFWETATAAKTGSITVPPSTNSTHIVFPFKKIDLSKIKESCKRSRLNYFTVFYCFHLYPF
jgi:hypothetical protein